MFRNHVVLNRNLIILGLLGISLATQAERAKEFGDYVVHYNAVTTDFLTPTTARQYKIKRSKNRGMVTIAMQQKVPGKAMGKPLSGDVTGHATNLYGQTRSLKFRKIVDGSAVYYIDDFSVTDKETIKFELSIKPEGQSSPYNLEFKQ